ncbi:MAG: ROK family transcriptional regulator [Muribaculaceae bacterium]|nr:ROK family transcriptional regulator [Muribaculaceae bacterium]
MAQDLLKALDNGSKNAMLKKRIINYFIYNGNSTISELSRALDISIPTVTKLIEEMCDNGLLLTYGKLETNEGRHPHLYGLNPDSGYFVGVDINLGSVNIALMNFNGEIVEHRINEKHKISNSAEGLDTLCKVIDDFVNGLDVDRRHILIVSVNISGRVNPDAGYSYSWFNLGEEPVAQIISRRLGLEVVVDNDSRAMTYGEYLCGNISNKKNLLFVNLSWGLGLGIIIDGKTYSGNSGFAGEFGHYPCYDNEVICHCGKKGCLETEASGNAIHRKLVERVQRGESSILSKAIKEDPTKVTLNDIIDAINHEDVLCIDLLEEVGHNLGKHIAGLINIFNPEEVVIGGILSQTGDYLVQPVRSSVRKHSLNLVNRDTVISVSRLKEKAGMIGACMLARARLFDNCSAGRANRGVKCGA